MSTDLKQAALLAGRAAVGGGVPVVRIAAGAALRDSEAAGRAHESVASVQCKCLSDCVIRVCLWHGAEEPTRLPVNALLLCPAFADTFWGFRHALNVVGRRAALPPLGLVTIAAMLMPTWRLRVVDTNVRPPCPPAISRGPTWSR